MGALMPGFYPPAFFASHPGAPVRLGHPLQPRMTGVFMGLRFNLFSQPLLLHAAPEGPQYA